MKTLLLSLLMFLAADTLSAQEKTTSEILQGKEWIMQFPNKIEGLSSEMKYTDKICIDALIVGGKRHETKNAYYLSDKESWIFDEQKIGLSGKGKYIIVNYEGRNPKTGISYKKVVIFEILKLTETELQLKNLSNNSILPFKSKEAE